MAQGLKPQGQLQVELVPVVEEDNHLTHLTLKNEVIGPTVIKGKKFTMKVLCRKQYIGNLKRQKHYLINLEFRKDLGEILHRYRKVQ